MNVKYLSSADSTQVTNFGHFDINIRGWWQLNPVLTGTNVIWEGIWRSAVA